MSPEKNAPRPGAWSGDTLETRDSQIQHTEPTSPAERRLPYPVPRTRWSRAIRLPLSCARPPYRFFATARRCDPRAAGNVLALHITERTTGHALRRDAAAVTRVAPAASVVAGSSIAAVARGDVALIAQAVGLPLVALDARPLEPLLRQTVTDLEPIPRALGGWLEYAGVVRDRRLADLLGDALGHAAEQGRRRWAGRSLARGSGSTGVPAMAKFVGLTARGLRDAFARSGLPAPVRWKVLVRTLIDAMFVQADAREPLTRVALRLGYPDSQALAHAFKRCFGVTPSVVRAHLGWQWLAWRWWERQRRARQE